MTIEKPLLRAISGRQSTRVPFWLMRQAGRYLPEYRKIRNDAGSFLNLCHNPMLAAEVTLQPIRRFGMDAAIIFSDILTVPAALGQKLAFEDGEGPKLEPIRGPAELTRLAASIDFGQLSPVYDALRLVSSELPRDTTLIGFSGAPWTLATYMVEGGSSRTFSHVLSWAEKDPASFGKLIDLLAESVTGHLLAQIDAGAEVVQIFDSWASETTSTIFDRCVVEPTSRIVKALKARYPHVPVIGFPRGIGNRYELFAKQTGVDVVSLDQGIDLGFARDKLQPITALQGCLDPMLLVEGGLPMRRAIREMVEKFGNSRYVFNLGHGVVPQTPPDHVAELSAILRSLPV